MLAQADESREPRVAASDDHDSQSIPSRYVKWHEHWLTLELFPRPSDCRAAGEGFSRFLEAPGVPVRGDDTPAGSYNFIGPIFQLTAAFGETPKPEFAYSFCKKSSRISWGCNSS